MNKQGCSNILNPIALAQQPPPPRTPPPPPMRQHPRPPPPPPQATAAPPNTDQRRIPARSSQDGHRRGGAGRVSGGRLHHHALPVRKVDRKTKDRYHGPQENLEACSSPQEKQHNSFMWKLPEAAEDWSEAKIFGEGLTGISWPFLYRRGGMSIHPHHPATTGMRYTTLDQNQTCSVECGCFCCQMLHTQTKRAIEAATWGWR